MTSIFVHGVSCFTAHSAAAARPSSDSLLLDENEIDALVSMQTATHLAKSCEELSQQVSVDALIECIAQKLHISSDSFHLQHDRRLLAPHQSLPLSTSSSCSSSSPTSSLLYLRIIPRAALVGGKGGFGSLLRASTTKVGAKKTSNFSASRDLSGRRMRHVEAEQKIAEWNSQPHETLTPAQMQAKYKAIKEGRPTVVPQCKFGAECKYKFTTCRKEHPVDHEAEAAAAAAAKRAPSMSDFIGEESEEGLKPVSKRTRNDAVLMGLAGKKRGRSGEEQHGYERKNEDEDDAQEDLEELQYEDDFSVDEDGEGDDDDQQQRKNERPNKRQHLDYLPSAVPALDDIIATSSSSSSSSSSRPASMNELISSPPAAAAASKFFASSSSSSSSSSSATPIFPAFSQRAPQLQEVAPEKAAQGLAAVLAKVKNKAATSSNSSSSSSSAAPAAAAAAASFLAIDLATIESIDVLAKFEAAHLSAELSRVGLKAGGTPQQRAERLFLLKSTPLDQIDAKHKAKK